MSATELTVVIPTFNERENVAPMLDALERALAGIAWEVVFVDDNSPDGTAQLVWQRGSDDPRIRCLLRLGRRGLSSACIEGMLASAAPYIAVIDADLQHDETQLPRMLDELKNGSLDIVIGSRYVDGGGEGDWKRSRVFANRLASFISRLFLKTALHDPMSGFFMLRRDRFMELAHNLSGTGFKILLDILSSAPRPLNYKEIPFQFRQRQHGESKIDTLVLWEFLLLMLDNSIGRVLPVRFLMFILVGCVGALTHLLVLTVFFRYLGQPFLVAQGIAVVFSMTQNFVVNNMLTYRDMRLQGGQFIRGLLGFYIACGIGGVVSTILADFLYQHGAHWFVAGLLAAIFAAVWNFATTSTIVWSRKRS